MTKPDLKLIEGGLGLQPAAEPHVPEAHEQGEMPFAVVDGEPVTQMPKDLYIPPDALQVFLEAFEGPLDLLLYLIRRQNLDILDIPIAEITRQYTSYIDVMRGMQLELAGEYLVMAATLAMAESAAPYVISGERNLLDVEELSSNMKRLRELFDLFEQRSSLIGLLDISHRAEGVQIFIGGESGIAPLDECSVIAAPYSVDGMIVGSVGVIGPTRMAYERVIPIVDITARLLSSALSYKTDH